MKYLKYLLYLILALILIAFVTVKILSETKPSTTSGPQADELAENMLDALNHDAFDTLKYIKWNFFRPGQKYVWDKKANKAVIYFDDVEVYMNLNTLEAKAFKGGEVLTGKAFEEAKAKAWSNWCNDSFWIFAPFKVFDPGTKRSTTKVDNQNALLVEYEGGGVTPGDAYLWILDDKNVPTAWKMWTSIIPVKGVHTSWENWETHNDILFSTKHKLFGLEMELTNVQAGDDLASLGLDNNLFDKI